MSDEPDSAFAPRQRRARDLSVIAPLIGLILLCPPLIGLFAAGRSLSGAPLILLYIGGVWLAMIVVAAILARSLRDESEP